MQRAWRRIWKVSHVLNCAASPDEALKAWHKCWDSWAWSQLACTDGNADDLKILEKKLWKIHFSVARLKKKRDTGQVEEDFFRGLSRATREAKVQGRKQ